MDREQMSSVISKLAGEEGIELSDYLDYQSCTIKVTQQEAAFLPRQQGDSYSSWYEVMLVSLSEYNRLEGKQEEIKESEVFVYSTGKDFGYNMLKLGDGEYQVKEELKECKIRDKEVNSTYEAFYVVVLSDMERLREAAAGFGVDASVSLVHQFEFNPVGEEERVTAFFGKLKRYAIEQSGFAAFFDYRDGKADIESIYGGLLFVGIFYGLIFLVCLLIIMYYKQITEGFEDQKNFEIMQKVGMSDEEIRKTIKKQILLVFALPLFGALLHTAVAMPMVIILMASINMFRAKLIIACAVAVGLLFAIFHGFCYRRTAGAYYRIVRQM